MTYYSANCAVSERNDDLSEEINTTFLIVSRDTIIFFFLNLYQEMEQHGVNFALRKEKTL